MGDEIRCSIEFRADDTRQSPGRLRGVLMHYETIANDRREVFARGSLQWREDGILIREQHNRQAPIVRAVPFLDGDMVRIDVAVPDTQRGRDAITNVNEGVFTGLSVEFRSIAEGRRNGLREIRSAMLGGAGLVDLPSYGDSIVEVRERLATVRPSEVTLWL